jgi:Sec-independent protein translocase protein TatA
VSTHASAGDLRDRTAGIRPKKLPELGKRIREAIRGIKSAMKEKKEEKAANGPSPRENS